MSNKSKQRLKKAKELEDKLNREMQEYEREQKEAAKSRQSKAAKKMIKKSKRKKPFGEPIYYFILKMLMIVPFGYSGFFYGGVLAAGVLGGAINDSPPKWVAWCVVAGVLVMGAGIIFAFFKKYIVSFVLTVVGTIPYMKSALYMIHKTQNYLSNRVVDPALQDLDKRYMMYYYPILGVALLGAILLIISRITKYKLKKKHRYEQDTAPVKSIVD